jgi:hypothetical protein
MTDQPVRASAQEQRIDEIEYRLNALPVEKRARDGTRLSPSNVEIMFEREQLQADVRFLLEVARGRQQAEQAWAVERTDLAVALNTSVAQTIAAEERVQQAEQARDELQRKCDFLTSEVQKNGPLALDLMAARACAEQKEIARRDAQARFLTERQRLIDSEERVAALTQALKDYGTHDESCIVGQAGHPCTCGLDAALTGATK